MVLRVLRLFRAFSNLSQFKLLRAIRDFRAFCYAPKYDHPFCRNPPKGYPIFGNPI